MRRGARLAVSGVTLVRVVWPVVLVGRGKGFRNGVLGVNWGTINVLMVVFGCLLITEGLKLFGDLQKKLSVLFIP